MRHGHAFIEPPSPAAGLALGIALPRLAEVQDGLEVDRAAREVASAHRRARIAALVRSRPVVLTISPDSLAYRVAGTSVGLWRAPGPARDGVVLGSPPRQITFSPVGITMGLANASFRFCAGPPAGWSSYLGWAGCGSPGPEVVDVVGNVGRAEDDGTFERPARPEAGMAPGGATGGRR
jgi:hypothetical protein